MIRYLPGGGLATGIGSLTAAEREKETAEQLWNGYMDHIRRQAAMRVRPVRAAHDADEYRSGATAARAFLEAADEYRSETAAAMFLERVEGPRRAALAAGA